MLESMRLHCNECHTTYEDLIERAERDDYHDCPGCFMKTAKRIMCAPAIRTSDSASLVDGSGRFDMIKQTRALQKEKARLKVSGDRVSEKKVIAELNKMKEK